MVSQDNGQIFRTDRKTHLTHKLLPVFVPCSSDVVVGSQLLPSTPGVQEVLDVRHGGRQVGEFPPEDLLI